MEFYEMTSNDVLEKLKSHKSFGLSEKEAQKRLNEYGTNTLDKKKKRSLILRFSDQFNDFMIIILLCAAAISFVTSVLDGHHDILEPVIILAIVTLNALLGTIQEIRAEHSLEVLKNLSSPTATVIRNGQDVRLNSQFVVPGDIIKLRGGDMVCADCRLIDCNGLRVDESSLTGEAKEITKDATAVLPRLTPMAELKNTVMASSLVTGGEATAVVTKTGMNTEMGKIASMLIDTDISDTPLQKRLAITGKILGISAMIICAVIFLIGIYKHIPPLDMFMTSVSLAVAAIPEGLPAIVTILLAMGVKEMSKHNAIVRNLPSVEILGCATVICTDKTGTLTRNEMTVAETDTKNLSKLLKLATLCTENGDFINPTDRAILQWAKNNGIDTKGYKNMNKPITSVPFDSKRKRMSVIADRKEIVKGAIEYILPLASYYDNGHDEVPMSENIRRSIKNANAKMTGDALRVIALAYKDNSSNKITENNLVFMGLIGIYDPPRKEIKKAVSAARNAGINTIMITGDHANTAMAIARKTGIVTRDEKAICSTDIDMATDDELCEILKKHHVFARVTPAHKLRIVKALQKNGEICAMTGDGVNDAPALKGADIGCSMGLCGTDVAKSASDIILTDDNFATIVYAVEEGRGIYDNIVKSVKFLLSSNIGEILTIMFGIIFNAFSPLTAIELLWINLVTDSLPAISLGLDPKDNEIMLRPPIAPDKPLLSATSWVGVVMEGLMIGALSLVAYGFGLVITHNVATARTMSFFVLAVSQLIHAFNMRSEKSVLNKKLVENKYLILSFFAGITAQLLLVYIPALSNAFNLVPLDGVTLVISLILSSMPLFLVELQKHFNAAILIKK